MILTLEIVAPPAAKLGAGSRQTFRAEGGSIGRATQNSLVLPHARVSGRHALITCRNAVFYIEDVSRNGVCINSATDRLQRGQPHALESGDRIYIDPYEIQVTITAESRDADRRPSPGRSGVQSADVQLSGGASPFDFGDPFPQRREPSARPESPEPVTAEELDPLNLLFTGPKQATPRKAPNARDLAGGSPLDGHYQPPVVPVIAAAPPPPPRPVVELIPQDYDPLADDSPDTPLPPAAPAFNAAPSIPPVIVEPRAPLPSPPAPDFSADVILPSPPAAAAPPPMPPVPAPVAAERPSDLAAVLEGAGLQRVAATPELARSFGQILRVVVAGVMDVLRSRQQIKDEFRMRMTRVRATDNNPLKFSADVDDALHNLLVKRSAAFLDPVEAFEDAFDDLRNHQIAMLAGMRVAFESMLAEFDPDRLQEHFDRQLKGGGLLSAPARLRYWDLYRDRQHEMIKDPEAAFRKLFGEEFARAYEEQLGRLKARTGGGNAPPRAPQPPEI